MTQKILLVEDSLLNQKIALRFLHSLGFKAQAVDSGIAAIAKLKEEFFDLVLMDCQMPEMDGYETTQKIRQLSKELVNQDIIIVALTANDFIGGREKCLEHGMNDYIAKPIDNKILKETLDKWLKGPISLAILIEKAPILSTYHLVLDPHRVAELRKLDDPVNPSIFRELGEPFIMDFSEKIKSIEESVESENFTASCSKAHQLVSSSGALAAVNLSNLFRKLERASENRDGIQAKILISEIKLEFEQVKNALRCEMTKVV